MGWSIGYDENWKRDIGYGVPSLCDHPGCGAPIDRGLSYVCGDDAYGGDHGCGLFFCPKHLEYTEVEDGCCPQLCAVCREPGDNTPFEKTPDTPEWIKWKLEHESWQQWRAENPAEVAALSSRSNSGEVLET